MLNLKQDLKNKLLNEKYYEEVELQRLYADQTMNHKDKVDRMAYILANISLLNAQLGLLEIVLPDTPAVAAPPVQNAPQGQVHPGQSHGE